MTNAEKFKTAEERVKAFKEWCNKQDSRCVECRLFHTGEYGGCRFRWLDLEAEEEKPLPCQYCGSETRVEEYFGTDHKPHYRVVCDDCYMQSCVGTRKDVVEKYNRAARAVMEARTKGEK